MEYSIRCFEVIFSSIQEQVQQLQMSVKIANINVECCINVVHVELSLYKCKTSCNNRNAAIFFIKLLY